MCKDVLEPTDLMTLADVKIRKRDWGGWKFDGRNVYLGPDGDIYWFSLIRASSAGQILDWIAQICNKSWATDKVLAGLVRCLDDLLNLQHNFCPSGESRSMDPGAVPRLARQNRKKLLDNAKSG